MKNGRLDRELGENRCLNVSEVADLLGVSINTLNAWRSQRRGPVYEKFGSRVVYRLADIQEYIARNRIKPD